MKETPIGPYQPMAASKITRMVCAFMAGSSDIMKATDGADI